jgi:acetoin utilization deacetylase AcuC-like enzyme
VTGAVDLYYTDHYELPLPAGHRFPKEKYRLLREALEGDARFRFHPAPLAAAEEVKLAHEAGYVEAFLAGRLEAGHMRRIGFPWSEAMVRRTLASAGGTLAAARRAMETGFAGALAGGTHHASRSEGAGYCVFNDIAVAIESLRRTHGVRRAAVIDLDVHQGDGTASIFEDDAEALTVSLHGRNNFPFRKKRSKIDVEFGDGAGDAEYLEALRGVLPRVAGFGAEVLFYQAGVDAHEADRLGKLSLTFEGLRARDEMVFETARRAGCPLVITLGGGYAEPVTVTVRAHANTFLSAAEWWVGESR